MAAQPSGGSACSLHNALSSVAGQNNAEYVTCASIPTDTVTGTTTGKLAKLTSTGKAIIASTSDTDGIVGVVTGTTSTSAAPGVATYTSGSVDIAVAGTVACTFDGATTAGNYVTISGTTAGSCTDAGSSRSTTKQTIGRVLSTNATAGIYDIVLDKAALNAAGGAAGSDTQVQYNSSGSMAGDSSFTYTTPGTLKLGVAAGSTGKLNLAGTTSGTITVQPQAAAGTYNFNLPTGAGSSGQPLLSGGGGATAMTFGTLGVTGGGTGLATATQGDLLYASAANTYSALAKNTSSTRYLSNTGASNNPAWAQIDLTNGVTGTLPVANGGTGAATLTDHGVLLGSGTGAVSATAVGATGTVLAGSTGADPSFTASPSLTSLTLSGVAALTPGTNYSTTGAQNNVSLGSFSTVRYTGVGTATFTGIAAGTNGQILYLHNTSASTLTLSNQSASSLAANRIITGTGADLPVPTNTSVTMQYDGTTAMWRVTGSSNSANTLAAGSTGQVQFNGGTNLAADSKLYWDNTNKRLGIGTTTVTSALTVIGSVDASAQFLGQASDTVSTPSFSWTGDTTTGVWRPAASTIAFSTAGSEAMRISSANNVGIGVSPSYRLHVTETKTDTSGTVYMQYNNLTVSPASTGTANFVSSENRSTISGATGSTGVYGAQNYVLANHTGTGANATTRAYGANNLVNNNSTGDIGTAYGTYSDVQNSSGIITTAYGTLSRVLTDSSAANNITTAVGSYGLFQNNGTGSITDGYGSYGYVYNSSTGTITTGRAAYARSNNAVGATMTSMYGVLVDSINNGSLSNWYGVYVSALSGNSPTTNRYPLYVADAGSSYFAGNIGLGTTAPATKLHITGTSALTVSTTDFDQVGMVGSALQLYPVASTGNSTSMALSAYYSGGLLAGNLLLNPNGGNVVIGTASSDSKLQVNGGAAIGYSASTTAPTNGLAVSGNVGIGTTTPGSITTTQPTTFSFKTDVRGNLAVVNQNNWDGFYSVSTSSGVTQYYSGLHIYNARGTATAPSASQSGDNLGFVRWGGYGTTGFAMGAASAEIRAIAESTFTDSSFPTSLTFRTASGVTAAERMRIDSSGNVGIGTSNPQSMLQIVNNVATGFLDSYSEYQLLLYQGGSAAASYGLGVKGGTMVFNSGGAYSFDGAGTSSLMVIASDGDVGIGTSSPSYDLSFAGDASKIFGMEANPTASTAGNYLLILAGDAASGGTNLAGGALYLRAGRSTGSSTASPIYFQTSAAGASGTSYNATATKMTILGSGNVGIGTTSPSSKFEVWTSDGGNAVVYGGANGAAESSYWNAQSRGRFGYDGSRGAVAIDDKNVNGTTTTKPIVLDTAGSERVRIDSSGNVGIGTTSTASKLQVNGGAAIGYSTSTTAPTNGLAVSGNVGIGTTTVNATLDVNGYTKLKVNSAAPVTCSATYRGSIAYTGTTTNYLCYCDGTSWKQVHSPGTSCTW